MLKKSVIVWSLKMIWMKCHTATIWGLMSSLIHIHWAEVWSRVSAVIGVTSKSEQIDSEWIVDGLPPSRGQSEWSVLFGQLSWGEMSEWPPVSCQKWHNDRQTERERDKGAKWTVKRRETQRCQHGNIANLNLQFTDCWVGQSGVPEF